MNSKTTPNRQTGFSGLFLRIGMKLRFLPLLVLGLIACPLRADQFGDFTYTNNTTYVTITGYTGSGGAVVIPSSIVGLPVTAIGNFAFYYKPTMTSVEIPATVTSIGTLAFSSNDALTGISVGAGNPAFSSSGGVLFNTSQTTLIQYPGGKSGVYTVPASVTAIGDSAFSSTASLPGVILPPGLISIGQSAFAYARGLSTVTIPANVSSIGSRAFGGIGTLTSISVDAANASFSGTGGVLFNKLQTTLIQCPAGLTGTYVIPNTVTQVGAWAFTNSKLSGVTIPNTVTGISEYGFYNCYQMTAISIPASVTSIGSSAFGACFSLQSINVDVANPNYSSVGGVLFNKAQTLLIQYAPGLEGAYVIPESVTVIGYEAFYNADELSTVTIPASVATIETYAFAYCYGLTSAIFQGNAPSLGYGVFDGAAPGFTVYFSNTATGFTTPTWQGYPSQMLTGGGGMDFRIATLGTTNSAVVDHTPLTGDDRGGIAITENVVLVTGDFYTGYYQASDLSGPTSLGLVHDGLCSDLATRKLYLLTNYGFPHSGGSANTINSLLEYNPESYAYPAEITLSQSIPIPAGFSGNCGVFSGYRRIVIHNGTNVYDIQIPSGTVTDLGPMTKPNWYNSESWAVWGVAEYYDGNLQLAYRQNSSNSIVRSRVPDGVTETIATFSNLGDMASWTVDPVRNRWYFHYEGAAQFGGSGETLGYADATFQVGGGAGSDLAAAVDAPSLSFTTGGSTPWISQSSTTHDGMDGAASGDIGDSQETWMETSVTGPGTLSFWWKVSSESTYDYLEFYIDGSLQSGRISGEVPWQQVTHALPSGTHTLRWRYMKDFIVSSGSDTAWVDEVVWTPGGGGNPTDLTWTSNGASITITGYIGTGGAVVIPPTIDGLPVTEIGALAFDSKYAVTGVTIPSTVTTIGNYAFYFCTGLASVTIPSSVTSIGWEAFSYCSSLTSVSIPSGVTSIGDGVFSGCSSLTSISVDAANPSYSASGGVLFNKMQTTLIQYPGGKSGGYTIPSSVTSIGWSAFAYTAGLTSVTISAGVTSIGAYAFNGCANLTDFSVDASNIFYSASGGVLFNKAQTILIQYPRGKSGGYSIPSGVTTIESQAFQLCSGLTSLTIPSSATSIGSLAFYFCTGLTDVTMQSGLTVIGPYAFYYCNKLTNVTIPSSVTNIGNSAFRYSALLSGATFQGNAPSTFGTNVFDNAAAGFTVSYYSGSTGFTSPTWQGYPSQMISAGSGFTSWASTGGLTGNNALPGAIPHGDGVPNLLKYAFGLNPSGPDARRMAPGGTVGLPAGYLHQNGGTVWRVEYLRRKNSGLTYTPKKSTTLGNGSFVPLTGTPVESEIIGFPDWQRVVIDEPFNPSTTPRLFTTVEVMGQ